MTDRFALLRRAGVATLILGSLACAALLIAAPMVSTTPGKWLTCIHWAISGGIAVLGTVLARGSAANAPDREGWGYLVGGQVLWFVAVVIYDFYVLATPGRRPRRCRI
ncbi:hypothetical protein [Kineosporia babensis]|uniref:Uncharacterized protein n=1 Tax=Kineosporia babensis TaxID=499548 RepID=A0A9X1NNF6_9ACTN|nr:hypothetical protein [Kineosporia babensis]MCD5316699.1 hypothetical protein [Kineosporia babensis]